MARIPLPLASAQDESRPFSAQRLLNVFPEAAPDNARSPFKLRTVPGLVPWHTMGDGPIRALNNDFPGILYGVSGPRAYRLSSTVDLPPGVPFDLGPVSNERYFSTIAVGPTAAVICTPPDAYTCSHGATDPLNKIAGDFPGATSVAYLNGQFIFTTLEITTSKFFVTGLLDPTQVNALDFAFSDAMPNVVQRAMTHRGELWLLGPAGIQVWNYTGNVNFPLQPTFGGVIPQGVAFPKSAATMDDSMWWIGVDSVVYRSEGYHAVRVSTHQIEEKIRAYGPQYVFSAFAYGMDGHSFYVAVFFRESDNSSFTIAYDAATKRWAERSSGPDGVGAWLPAQCATTATVPIFGDGTTGDLYILDSGIATDRGFTRPWEVTLPPIWADTHRAFMHRFEIETDTGSFLTPGDITLDWSDDGGYTFGGGPRTLTGGRRYTSRLGSFRQRVMRLRGTGGAAFYGANADISGGKEG
jgi:hypothetical protein